MGFLSPKVKWQRCGTDHSPQCSIQNKTDWNYKHHSYNNPSWCTKGQLCLHHSWITGPGNTTVFTSFSECPCSKWGNQQNRWSERLHLADTQIQKLGNHYFSDNMYTHRHLAVTDCSLHCILPFSCLFVSNCGNNKWNSTTSCLPLTPNRLLSHQDIRNAWFVSEVTPILYYYYHHHHHHHQHQLLLLSIYQLQLYADHPLLNLILYAADILMVRSDH